MKQAVLLCTASCGQSSCVASAIGGSGFCSLIVNFVAPVTFEKPGEVSLSSKFYNPIATCPPTDKIRYNELVEVSSFTKVIYFPSDSYRIPHLITKIQNCTYRKTKIQE